MKSTQRLYFFTMLLSFDLLTHKDRIGGVMVSVLASNAEGRGFDPCPGQTKDIEMVFAAFLLSMQHYGVRAKSQNNVSR